MHFSPKFHYLLNLFWLLPIFAVIIIVFSFWQKESISDEIVIRFNSAQGIDTAQKVHVKYRDLVVGEVTRVRLNDDLSGVWVYAKMYDFVKEYINSNTRFWVVRPNLDFFNLSGVDTIFSGEYIGVDLAFSGSKKVEFIGLDQPPIIAESADGIYITLNAQQDDAISISSPLYLQSIEIGKVDQKTLVNNKVQYRVFIKKQFKHYITPNSVFWRVNPLSASINNGSFDVKINSLKSLLLGGISTTNPQLHPFSKNKEESNLIRSNTTHKTEYAIFKNKESALEDFMKIYKNNKTLYALKMNKNQVEGLQKFSDIELMGVKVGYIKDIEINFSKHQKSENGIFAFVIVELDFDSIGITGNTLEEKKIAILNHVKNNNLRFSINYSSFLTGQKKIQVFFDETAQPIEKLETYKQYTLLPIVSSELWRTKEKLDNIISKLEALPWKKTLNETTSVLKKLNIFLDLANDKPERFIFGD